MFNLITIITIIAASLSLSSLKPAHLQEYDFIDDIPTIEITAPRYEHNRAMSHTGMMPEVIVTAARPNNQDDIAEVVVTAPRYEANQDIKPYYGMMTEVVVTAERYRKAGGLFELSQVRDTTQGFNRQSANGFIKHNIY